MSAPIPSYNERLFGGGLRGWYHMSRFEWAADLIKSLPPGLKVVELGCFDGRIVDAVGNRLADYVGIDANWEGGLDLAGKRFEGRSDVHLVQSADPADFAQFADGQFDLALALETLEHLPPGQVPRYLDELARVTRGYLLVSVPNELGPVFFAKYVAKAALYRDAQQYRPGEVIAATLRRSDLVERDDHKGFDYRDILREIDARFDVLSVRGLPRTGLPPALSPTVAIFARSRGG